MPRSGLEQHMARDLRVVGAPPWQEEYRFSRTRGWRLDFAWPVYRIAIEVEGGIWRRGGGAHSHPKGIERDIEKSNAALLAGWRVYRVTEKMLDSGDAAALVCRIFGLPLPGGAASLTTR